MSGEPWGAWLQVVGAALLLWGLASTWARWTEPEHPWWLVRWVTGADKWLRKQAGSAREALRKVSARIGDIAARMLRRRSVRAGVVAPAATVEGRAHVGKPVLRAGPPQPPPDHAPEQVWRRYVVASVQSLDRQVTDLAQTLAAQSDQTATDRERERQRVDELVRQAEAESQAHARRLASEAALDGIGVAALGSAFVLAGLLLSVFA